MAWANSRGNETPETNRHQLRHMKQTFPLLVAATFAMSAFAADPAVRLITLDPGHFHAALVQKTMYPQVSPVVHVYAPEGPDLAAHLKRIEGYNTRAENPARWEEKVFTGPDFLDRMCQEKAGNVVVISGNNRQKTEYIEKAVAAGLNVLADKPMTITPAGFRQLRQTFDLAQQKKVLLYDIMTERYEATIAMQRELAGMPELFGTLVSGTPDNPGVVMESVHHFCKQVSGSALIRPAWFFDVRQQGEAIPDVGTHLIDLVQWQCFPGQTLDWQKDIQVTSARRWPTTLTPAQFKQVTGLDEYPEFLKSDVGTNGALLVQQNGEVNYTLRGVHAKVIALWNYEAPAGGRDTHYARLRGSRANLVIKQGAEQKFNPTLYVENISDAPAADLEKTVRAAVAKLAAIWPGVDVKPAGQAWEIVVPAKYNVGHEAHFAQVAEKYLGYLEAGKIPAWETAGMLAKYYTSTEACRLTGGTRD
jgi:predicted dehydrogenase